MAKKKVTDWVVFTNGQYIPKSIAEVEAASTNNLNVTNREFNICKPVTNKSPMTTSVSIGGSCVH